MLANHEKEKQRLAFELEYARYAQAHAGLEGTLQEIAARVKDSRVGDRYETSERTHMWSGYQLTPYPGALSASAFTANLDRDGLERCIRIAQERLQLLNDAERTETWSIYIDGFIKFTATQPMDAMSWLSRCGEAYKLSPPPAGDGPLDRGVRTPVSIEYRKVYPDELAKLLAANGDKPEDIAQF